MIYFLFVIFKREILTDVYRADVTFLIPIEEMDFFYSLALLFCAVLLLTVLFLFQKAAINNTLISKESL